ncbi:MULTISPECIES: hypothetical protein [unclassified Rhodococcus (in: high G+C Gram-positive bacteria)]|nr:MULTISPECIES: hypothetical protein [unclassified Rhodococcus (in: high G+C Gram-positive bacteria)]MDV8056750.1 hypothetical protein [Rhodococcus sp. IEGM 1343]MDV8076627.1 hypothetical protein [Rhodococcus sp. IEGM 1370]
MTWSVLVLFDPVIPIPITLTAVVMIVVVGVLVARGPTGVEHEKLTT